MTGPEVQDSPGCDHSECEAFAAGLVLLSEEVGIASYIIQFKCVGDGAHVGAAGDYLTAMMAPPPAEN